MKRKKIYMMIVAAIAVAAAWNVSQSKSEMALTDVALENVEASAGGEGGVTCCPDAGDTCKLSSGDTLRDFDEC
ncbi:MAG: NVEALA domain-containing protein [Tannerella sp.]|jgi:hypothetical protein|nr:NVEALA domain-containing protein [Tannerella sp.]